jgi:hypothetical protein
LKPRAERPLDVYGVMNELRPQARRPAGLRVFMQNPPAIRHRRQLSK